MPIINQVVSDMNFWWIYNDGKTPINVPFNVISELTRAEDEDIESESLVTMTFFPIPGTRELAIVDDYKTVALKYNVPEEDVKKNSFVSEDKVGNFKTSLKYSVDWDKFVKDSFVVVVLDKDNKFVANAQGTKNNDIYDIIMIQVYPNYQGRNVCELIIEFIIKQLHEIINVDVPIDLGSITNKQC